VITAGNDDVALCTGRFDGDDSDNKVADPGSDDGKHDYDAFFDSDGAFDAEGYIKFNKWPGYGQHLGGDKWRLVSTRMEIHDAGAEYGIFVDIEAKDRPIIITGVKIAAHGLSNREQAHTPTERDTYMQDPLVEPSDPFALSVYMCEGSSRGKETDRSAWRLMATNESIQLPRINGKEDWDAEYRERFVLLPSSLGCSEMAGSMFSHFMLYCTVFCAAEMALRTEGEREGGRSRVSGRVKSVLRVQVGGRNARGRVALWGAS
jgi:hypothetical protein